MMTFRGISILVAALVLACCTERHHDTRLSDIERLASEHPESALDSLKAIDYQSLSETDKHLYDFLSVKVPDKSYVSHTTDSLILDVIDYESRHQGNGRYPEALYYGGRVYTDLGDYPTALRYFNNAMDALPEEADITLRRNIVSQTGRLLQNLFLTDQAIPYLEESLRLTEELGGHNLHYDYQLLGAAYQKKGDHAKAEQSLKRAWELSRDLPSEESFFTKGLLAELQFNEGNVDSALTLIRHVPENVAPSDRDFFTALAADIYSQSALYDSARMYADEAIHSPNLSYKVTGYKILLSPELRRGMHPDSLSALLDRYLDVLHTRYNEHRARAAIIQNSLYNYSLHERQSLQLARSREKLLILISAALSLCFLLTVVIFYFYRVAARKKVELFQALSTIKDLNSKLRLNKQSSDAAAPDDITLIIPSATRPTTEAFRERLREEITRLKSAGNSISNDAADTPVYRELQSAITQGRILSANDSIWGEIDDTIDLLSPSFRQTIKTLSGNKLSAEEYRLAALIRMGITPTQASVLFGRVKGAISYRRKILCQKLFHGEIELSDMDSILRLL